MRNTIRLFAAFALSIPVLLGAAGLASADDASYEHHVSVATPEGAGFHSVWSGTDGETAYFFEVEGWADENGAYSSQTGAVAGGHDHDDGHHGWGGGDAHYWDHFSYAGEEGAYQESTHSSTG